MSDLHANALFYLATPYSRYATGLHQAFVEACNLAARLLRINLKCYSPISHTHPIALHGGLDPLDHGVWLAFDLAMMTRADVLLVAHLPGWEESYGIAEEIKFFERAGKRIFDLDPASLEMEERKRAPPPRERYDGLTDGELRQQTNDYLQGETPLAHGKTPSEHAGGSP